MFYSVTMIENGVYLLFAHSNQINSSLFICAQKKTEIRPLNMSVTGADITEV